LSIYFKQGVSCDDASPGAVIAVQTKDGAARVIYEAKDGKGSKTFTALDWDW